MRAAKFVGRLTAADGAVVLNPALGVVSIGASLHSKDKLKMRHLTLDAMARGDIEPFYPNIVIQSIFAKRSHPVITKLPKYNMPRGKRFESGVTCALKDQDALVFVASEDGPIAAMVGVDDEVLIAEPISLERDMLW